MEVQLIDAFILIGLVQGLFFTILILGSPQYQNKANRYLAATIFCVTVMGILAWIRDLRNEPPWAVFFGDWMWEFLFIVTFLFFFLERLQVPWRNALKMKLLHLPFIITLVINVVIDLDEEFGLYDLDLERYRTLIETYYFVEYILAIIFVFAINFWAFRLINKYGQEPAKNWLLQFWWMTNIVLLFWLFDFITDLSAQQDYVKILWLLVAILFFWVTYSSVTHLKVAEDQQLIRQQLKGKKLQLMWPEVKEVPAGKDLYFEKLNRLVQEQKLYLDPDINREKIAQQLGISPGYLSQVINEQSVGNFSDYINWHRVEAVKAMLLDPEFNQYSIVAIGHEAGFNSKSNFYAVFKRQTRLTPSEFKKSIFSN